MSKAILPGHFESIVGKNIDGSTYLKIKSHWTSPTLAQ